MNKNIFVVILSCLVTYNSVITMQLAPEADLVTAIERKNAEKYEEKKHEHRKMSRSLHLLGRSSMVMTTAMMLACEARCRDSSPEQYGYMESCSIEEQKNLGLIVICSAYSLAVFLGGRLYAKCPPSLPITKDTTAQELSDLKRAVHNVVHNPDSFWTHVTIYETAHCFENLKSKIHAKYNLTSAHRQELHDLQLAINGLRPTTQSTQ